MHESLRDVLSSLRVSKETDSYCNILPRKNALVVFICQVPDLEEGQEDEMFWMFLGDSDGYAHASYWKWRKSDAVKDALAADPRIWSVDCKKSKEEARVVA